MPFTIVALGDSIIWGQGLADHEKFTHRVRGSVAGMFKNTDVQLKSFAHSGATIARHHDDSTAYWGEIPVAHPSVLARLDMVRKQSLSRDEVYLVLLDGGINDVRIDFILTVDPTIADKNLWVRKQVRARIAEPATGHGPMRELALEAARAFPNAIVIVTGYFPILSQRSNVQHAATVIAALLGTRAGLVGAAVSAVTVALVFQNLIQQADAFHDESRKALSAAVTSANAALGSTRVYFADPGYAAEHAMSADQTRLFDGYNDALYWERCQRYISDPLRYPAVTPIASLAHPNADGARMYWSSIMAQIRAAGSRFGPPAPSPECAQIKQQIAAKREEENQLIESKAGLNPRTDRMEIVQINRQISALLAEISALQQRSAALGCP